MKKIIIFVIIMAIAVGFNSCTILLPTDSNVRTVYYTSDYRIYGRPHTGHHHHCHPAHHPSHRPSPHRGGYHTDKPHKPSVKPSTKPSVKPSTNRPPKSNNNSRRK